MPGLPVPVSFFFQAEAGIRYLTVTGVQTCALPIFGERGLKSLLIGVPPGYPPKPVNGWRVSCFLTPPSAPSFTHPEDLATEIKEELGGQEYIFDIPNFREQGYEFVLEQVFKMTERRFQVARRFVRTKPWDYFMLVEMG